MPTTNPGVTSLMDSKKVCSRTRNQPKGGTMARGPPTGRCVSPVSMGWGQDGLALLAVAFWPLWCHLWASVPDL
jgi:hypothetical protein